MCVPHTQSWNRHRNRNQTWTRTRIRIGIIPWEFLLFKFLLCERRDLLLVLYKQTKTRLLFRFLCYSVLFCILFYFILFYCGEFLLRQRTRDFYFRISWFLTFFMFVSFGFDFRFFLVLFVFILFCNFVLLMLMMMTMMMIVAKQIKFDVYLNLPTSPSCPLTHHLPFFLFRTTIELSLSSFVSSLVYIFI